MFTRCFIPFENSPTFLSRQSSMRTSWRASSTFFLLISGGTPLSLAIIIRASLGVNEE